MERISGSQNTEIQDQDESEVPTNQPPVQPIHLHNRTNFEVQATENPYRKEEESFYIYRVMFCCCKRELTETEFIEKFLLTQIIIDGVSFLAQLFIIFVIPMTDQEFRFVENTELVIFFLLTVANLIVCIKARETMKRFIITSDRKLINETSIFDWSFCMSIIINCIEALSSGIIMGLSFIYGIQMFHEKDHTGAKEINGFFGKLFIAIGFAFLPLFLTFMNQIILLCNYSQALESLKKRVSKRVYHIP